MGNEASDFRGIDIDDEVVEVTDSWSLHNSNTINGSITNLSTFVSQSGDDTASSKNSKLSLFSRVSIP